MVVVSLTSLALLPTSHNPAPQPTTPATSLPLITPTPPPPIPPSLLTPFPPLHPAIFGPLATTWFGFLQRRVHFAGRPNATILARVGLDQTVLAPGNLFLFLNTMALLEGTSAKEKLETTYWPALSRNWMIWPVVQFVNFKYVPLELRVLVVNVVSLGWNCYLSYLNGQGGSKEDELSLIHI